MHSRNAFINLTYSDDHLPDNYSVSVRVMQDFMKKLRYEIAPRQVRFFACGEYGPSTHRPHYHALLFGYSFDDLKLFMRNHQGDNLYTSAKLTSWWGKGHCTVGAVTYQSAAYVARYIMKKISGERADDHYCRVHPITGKIVNVEPEFCTQSRMPGIGASWFDKYKNDAFPSDFLIVDGQKRPVPKYYLDRLEKEETPSDPYKLSEKSESEKVIFQRKEDARPRKADNTPARLRVRQEIKQSQLNQLKRDTLK